jgi:Pyruvate/2-oxoacid:ferredoxin oxidoreductase gamma subunit
MSPDLINMAHIRVAGVGGLGMLGAAVVTAISLPEIGVALVAGVGAGAAIAAGLIVYRRRSSAAGPRADDGQPPRVLALDDHAARVDSRAKRELPGTPVAATA